MLTIFRPAILSISRSDRQVLFCCVGKRRPGTGGASDAASVGIWTANRWLGGTGHLVNSSRFWISDELTAAIGELSAPQLGGAIKLAIAWIIGVMADDWRLVLITAASLRSRTSKELAQLAKSKGVPGWHSMRKEQLIRSLVNHSKRAPKVKRDTASSRSRSASLAGKRPPKSKIARQIRNERLQRESCATSRWSTTWKGQRQIPKMIASS